MTTLACQLDTAPLDLGRCAAQLCGDWGVSLAGEVQRSFDEHAGHGWGWASETLERKFSGLAFQRFMGNNYEMLHIPCSYFTDRVDDPVEWIKDMLFEYGGWNTDEQE